MSHKQLETIMDRYRKSINQIQFAKPEQNWLNDIDSSDDSVNIIDKLVQFSIELNSILENCPDSITVMDADGKTLRANKTFEDTTGIKREEIIGRNIVDMEEDGFFKPSVYSIVKRGGRKISVLQDGMNWRAVATGAPVYRI